MSSVSLEPNSAQLGCLRDSMQFTIPDGYSLPFQSGNCVLPGPHLHDGSQMQFPAPGTALSSYDFGPLCYYQQPVLQSHLPALTASGLLYRQQMTGEDVMYPGASTPLDPRAASSCSTPTPRKVYYSSQSDDMMSASPELVSVAAAPLAYTSAEQVGVSDFAVGQSVSQPSAGTCDAYCPSSLLQHQQLQPTYADMMVAGTPNYLHLDSPRDGFVPQMPPGSSQPGANLPASMLLPFAPTISVTRSTLLPFHYSPESLRFWPSQAIHPSLISGPVSPVQGQQAVWRFQGPGAPLLIDHLPLAPDLVSGYEAPGQGQYWPALRRAGATPASNQEAGKSAEMLRLLQQDQLVKALASLRLEAGCPPHLLPTNQETGLIYRPAMAYPPQASSPYSLYAFSHRSHLNQSSLEMDHEDWAKIMPNINPLELDTSLMWNGRYFVIKSNSKFDILQSLRNGVWCSTPAGNDLLHTAYLWANSSLPSMNPAYPDTSSSPTIASAGHVLLFFSVNSSGCFCGVAEMMSPVDKQKRLSIWQDPRWRGVFSVRWIYVKDVPNRSLRHIQVECLENKAVTHLRDANEILPASKGEEVLKIIHNY